MKLYNLGTVSGTEVFIFTQKKPVPLRLPLNTPRTFFAFRVSEQPEGLYIRHRFNNDVALIKPGRVIIFFERTYGYSSSLLAIEGAHEYLGGDKSGTCAVLEKGKPFTLYTLTDIHAWKGVAGKTELSPCMHPHVREI